MALFKQEYIPSAPMVEATVQLADKSTILGFKHGDKLMLRARAGRVLAIDYQTGRVKIAFLAEKASVYRATGWAPVEEIGTEQETEFVSYMSDIADDSQE